MTQASKAGRVRPADARRRRGIRVQDRWEFQGDTLRLERAVTVQVTRPRFLSAAILPMKERGMADVQWFVRA